jgi:hypothetical protein
MNGKKQLTKQLTKQLRKTPDQTEVLGGRVVGHGLGWLHQKKQSHAGTVSSHSRKGANTQAPNRWPVG